MTAPALGLSGYRWNNNLKSMLLLAAFPALLFGLVWAFFLIVGYAGQTPSGFIDLRVVPSFGVPWDNAPFTPLTFAFEGLKAYGWVALGLAAFWLVIGGLFNQSLIQMSTGAKAVQRKENPELYNLLENLCLSRGLQMPSLFVIETPVMNAYASGLGAGSFSITVTRGLLETLNRDELEAVLGHELTHIINRDVRLLVVTVLFGGMISFFAELMWRSLYYRPSLGNDRRGRGNGFVLIVAAALLSVGYVIALLLRFALSRKREYLADAGSVELTKNPEALIHALQKISGRAAMPGVPSGVQAMMIENPPGAFDWFDTHPPIESRIAVLRRLGGLPDKGHTIIPQS